MRRIKLLPVLFATLFLMVSFVIASSPTWGQTPQCQNVDAGFVANYNAAKTVCPKVCVRNASSWNGQWTTINLGKDSVCGCCKAGPAIAGFSPSALGVGQTLTVTGSNFASTASQNVVTFGGGATAVAGSVVKTATSLTVTVPAGARSGPLTIASNGVASAASAASLNIIPSPTISSFSPASVAAGDTVTITGSNFASTASQNVVTFGGGVTAFVDSVGPKVTSLTVTVPLGAQSGALTVMSNGIASAASKTLLTVKYPPGSTCSNGDIQKRLNDGQTPQSIYKLCGKNMSLLYGKRYDGGLIAYMNQADGSGFVAAPEDYSKKAFWVNMTGNGFVKTGATGTAIGTGSANTSAIVTTQGVPAQVGTGQTYNYAAYLSRTQVYNGYSGWYLPSLDEMMQVLQNVLTPQGVCGGSYWTSTEVTPGQFDPPDYNKAFTAACGGNFGQERKNQSHHVRLIRAFPDPGPSVDSLMPATVNVGAALTITGSDFAFPASQNVVTFDSGATAVADSVTAGSLTVTVPPGAQSGPLTVTSNGITSAASKTSLTVRYPPGSTCSNSDIQKRLNNGQTPLSIYKLCGKKMSLLYGKSYRGGLIAYMNPADGSGFVAAPEDYSKEAFWVNRNTGYSPTLKATATAIGGGKANTQAIVKAFGDPSSQPAPHYYNYAAYAAVTASYNEYRDWYLPDEDEMVQVLQNVIVPSGDCPDNHWTSTKSSISYYRAVYIDCAGAARNDLQNSAYLVRAIRDFALTEPSITSFSPTLIGVGRTLTITGSDFSTTASKNVVTFGGGYTGTGVAAAAISATATMLTVVVPKGATSGPITVTAGGISSKVSSVSLNVLPVPTVASFAPSTVTGGKTLTITGGNFASTASQNVVTFGGNVTATADSVTKTTLVVTVPTNAISGPIVVTSNGVASDPSAVKLNIQPTITAFSPPAVGIGRQLTISGSNFSPSKSEDIVTFAGGVTATPIQASATSLLLVVPEGATTGSVTVTTDSVPGPASSTSLTVASVPTIKSLQPNPVGIGLSLYIEGSNFAQTVSDNIATFTGGATAKGVFSGVSNGRHYLVVKVPKGAQSGPITITANGVTSDPSSSSLAVYPVSTITGFSPTTVTAGQMLTITGTNFSPNPADDTVILNGARLVPSTASANKLTVVVPPRAYSGLINVDTYVKADANGGVPGKYSKSALDVVPTVTDIRPQVIEGGQTLTITGTGFRPDSVIVFADDVPVRAAGSGTQITAVVPAAAQTGNVTVEGVGMFLKVLPTVKTFAPAGVHVGDTVTINGSNFSKIAEDNVVVFNGGKIAVPTSAMPTALTVKVPDGASSGSVYVVTDGSSKGLQSTTVLTIQPNTANASVSWSGKVGKETLYGLAWGAGQFVAVGWKGNTFRSEDGQSWESHTVPQSNSAALLGITYANNQFVAVGYRYSGTPSPLNKDTIFTSPDGKNWTTHSAEGFYKSVTYGNGTFMAVGWLGGEGYVATSTDGSKWSVRKFPGEFFDAVAYGANLFVSVSPQKIRYSVDGVTWTDASLSVRTPALRDVTWSEVLHRFVAVGSGRYFFVSTDGKNWTSVPAYDAYYSVAWSDWLGVFAAVGYKGEIKTSLDGENWVRTTNLGNVTLEGVISGKNEFVAVGDRGTVQRIVPRP